MIWVKNWSLSIDSSASDYTVGGLGFSGYATRRPPGRLTIDLEGDPAALQALAEKLRRTIDEDMGARRQVVPRGLEQGEVSRAQVEDYEAKAKRAAPMLPPASKDVIIDGEFEDE